jgi:hypothetical protein
MEYESTAYLEAFATVNAACAWHGKPMGTGAYNWPRTRALLPRTGASSSCLPSATTEPIRGRSLATVEALR